MIKKQSSIFLFLSFVVIIVFFALSEPSEWRLLDAKAFPKEMNEEQIVNIFKNEQIAYKIGESGNIEVPKSELSKAELLLTGLRAIQNLQDEHSPNDVVVELVIQQSLKRKIDDLLNNFVEEGSYISEVYITPTHNSLPNNKSIKPNDLVAYFLNSPGLKRVHFRLIVDSDSVNSKELDSDFIESRIKRHLRTLLYDLKAVRLTEEIIFIPFHGTGLSSVAMTERGETPQQQWVSKLFIPLMVASALLITLFIILLVKKQRRHVVSLQKEADITFKQDFESISFEEDSTNPNHYIHLSSLSPGVIEGFTKSEDIGNILPFLHPKEAAKFLQMLPFEQQVRSIGGCIGYQNLDSAKKEQVIEKVSRQIGKENLHDLISKSVGIKHIAKILNEFPLANGNRILQELHQVDAQSLMRLKNEFFVLTALLPLGSEGIRYVLKAGGGLDLLLAVHDSDSQIKDKVLGLFPEEAHTKLSEDVSKVDPSKVQSAQLRIARLIAEFNRKQVETKKRYQKV